MERTNMRRVVLPALALSFAAAVSGQPPSATVALVGARVIDGTGTAPVPNAAILIRNGRIERVGAAESLKIPAGATRIDVKGKTIIPGLINAHGHLNNGDRSLAVYDQIIQQLKIYTRFGVTTVFALGDDGKESVRVSDENVRSPLDRARLFAAGGRVTAKSPEDARRLIAERQAQRVNVIKTGLNGNSNDMPREVYSALIEEAHKRNLRVAAHLFNLEDAKGAVAAGLDVIAHSIRDRDVDAAFVAELRRRNVGYIPTVTRDLSVFQYDSTPAYVTDPFFLRGEPLYTPQIASVKDPSLHAKTRSSPGTGRAKQGFDQALRNLKLLSDGGVMIAMGTDSGTSVGRWQGYYEHVEIELMVQAGMSPMQALVAATGNAAKVMRIDAELGTLQPGKRADLVVLAADPLADIKNTRTIESVWVDGRRLN
jgi:imidazolonepropionase-like amidohydrolase